MLIGFARLGVASYRATRRCLDFEERAAKVLASSCSFSDFDETVARPCCVNVQGPRPGGGSTGRGVGAELEDSTLNPNLATHGDDIMTQKGRPEAALH
jgi:hypothetical protein